MNSRFEREQDNGLDEVQPSPLRDYLSVLRRRWWLVAAFVILTPVCAYYLANRQAPVYEASADVLIGRAAGLGDFADAGNAERTRATLEKLARLPAVAERVIASQGITNQTAGGFLSDSSVSTTTGADLMTFTVRSSTPARAAGLATVYAREFTKYRRSLDSTSIAAERDELWTRIQKLTAANKQGTPLYRALVARDEQLAALELSPNTTAVVVQPGADPAQVAPHPLRNGVLGVGLGLLLAIAAAFLAEALDTRVRTSEEVERRLRRPILGHLAVRSRRKQVMLTMLADPASAEAEAVRMLRANFDYARVESGARSVMFSSFGGGDGEESSAAVGDLAVALARAGRDVILCDLDCRHPSVASMFGVEGLLGVTDVALGRSELWHALTTVDTDTGEQSADTVRPFTGTLKVLPRHAPAEPADFVGSESVARLLTELTKSADIVLVQTPPLLAVSDSIALSGSVDALVLVTRLESLRRGTLSAVERALLSSSAQLLGTVILGSSSEPTQAPVSKPRPTGLVFSGADPRRPRQPDGASELP